MKKLKEPCNNCGKREATCNWLGQGSMMDFTHGNYSRWCDVCVLEYQIPYMEREIARMSAELPEKRRELSKLKNE